MKYVVFRGKKIPLFLANLMFKLSNHIIPLNKFNRDLFSSIYKSNNKNR